MSRKLKNILMVTILCILVLTSFITYKLSNSNIYTNNNSMDIRDNRGWIPDMQNENDKSMMPPDMENKEFEERQMPNTQDGGMKQRREKTTQSDSASSNNLEEENDTYELSLMNNETTKNSENTDFMTISNNIEVQNIKVNQNKNTDYLYYILFGVQGIFISLIAIYLVMSNFNEKNFKETLKNSEKIVIYSLSVIILSLIIVFGLISL